MGEEVTEEATGDEAETEAVTEVATEVEDEAEEATTTRAKNKKLIKNKLQLTTNSEQLQLPSAKHRANFKLILLDNLTR